MLINKVIVDRFEKLIVYYQLRNIIPPFDLWFSETQVTLRTTMYNLKSLSDQELSYSNSQSPSDMRIQGIRSIFKPQKIQNSLQYLDTIRSLRKDTQSHPVVSELESLIRPTEITPIDNEGLYGIVSIKNYTELKSQIKSLLAEADNFKVQISNKDLHMKQMLLKFENLKQEKQSLLKNLQELSASYSDGHKKNYDLLTNQVLLLQSKIDEMESKNQKLQQHSRNAVPRHEVNNDFKQLMLSEVQTNFQIPKIEIPKFEFNLEQILSEIDSSKGQQTNKQSIKQVVESSLDEFCKNLEEQFKVIQAQRLQISSIEKENKNLKEENQFLKDQKAREVEEEQKLANFKETFQKFLTDVNKEVSQKIDEQKNVEQILRMLSSYKPNENIKSSSKEDLEKIVEGFPENSESVEKVDSRITRRYEDEIKILKEENIRLWKQLGQQRHKWGRVEKVMSQSVEPLSDEGTVGQLVKVSKMVKEAIKVLMQEI